MRTAVQLGAALIVAGLAIVGLAGAVAFGLAHMAWERRE